MGKKHSSSTVESAAERRENRDCMVLGGICAAITLIDAEEHQQAADVLRLARDRFAQDVEVSRG